MADAHETAEGLQPDYDGHHICWVEFGSADNGSVIELYSNLFGWAFETYAEFETYEFYVPPYGVMGGFNSALEEGAPDMLVYVYVEDIESALARIEEAGGKTVVPKMIVHQESGGSVAVFRDPNDLLMGLADMWMEPQPVPNPISAGEEKPVTGSICYFEIYSPDFEKTGEFYKHVFGWEFEEQSVEVEGSTEQYMRFSPGNGTEGVFQSHTADIPVLVYIWVDDVQKTLDQATAAGCETFAPMISPMGVFGYFKDPSGVWIGLLGSA